MTSSNVDSNANILDPHMWMTQAQPCHSLNLLLLWPPWGLPSNPKQKAMAFKASWIGVSFSPVIYALDLNSKYQSLAIFWSILSPNTAGLSASRATHGYPEQAYSPKYSCFFSASIPRIVISSHAPVIEHHCMPVIKHHCMPDMV